MAGPPERSALASQCNSLLSAFDPADPDQAVDAGAKALDGYWDYPWYDAANDDIRRINVKAPKPPKPPSNWNSNWNWRGGSWEWLTWLSWAVIAGLLAALVYLLIKSYLTRETGSLTAAAQRQAATGRELDRVEALPFEVDKPRADLLGEARRLYELGRYGEAVVYLFSHQLLELDKHHFIRLAKGKTNRQYLREVSPRKPLGKLLEQTMVAFEDFFFGSHPLDRARFELCWGRLDEFGRLVQEGAIQ